MKEQDLDQTYQSLMARYLSGNASDAQVMELESWVAASRANKRQFMEMKKTWHLMGMSQDSQTIDIEKAWRHTSTQLKDGQEIQLPSSSARKWLAIAASMIVLAVASFLLFQQFGGSHSLVVNTTSSEKTFDLSDGSHIALNQSSSLTYLLDKELQQRKVSLVGDAFFDVARDESAPFIIETKHLEIQVLGTSFYVDARDDEDQVQIIVESGMVAVRTNETETILTAHEKAIFYKNDARIVKQKNTDSNFTSLKTKTLIFENTSLSDVIFALNRQFNVNIRLNNPTLAECPLTSTFKNKSLASILTIIKSTLDIDIRQTQNQIIFVGNCTLE